jgi:hypothetical protein
MLEEAIRSELVFRSKFSRIDKVNRVLYEPPARFSLPLGRSRMTIILLFLGPLGPGLRVRLPFVAQPQTETGCLLDLDFPRPPP